MTIGKQLPWQPKKRAKSFNSKQKQTFFRKYLNKLALAAEYIIKSSILSCITFFTTFRKLPEKTCCPKINEKFFFLYLHGLRIPNMYSYLVPHLVITPSSLSAWSKSNHVRIATDVEFFWGVFCMGDLRSCTFLL